MMALNANYVLTGKSGDRLVPAREFYQGIYVTALQPGEVLTAIRITPPPKGHGYAYNKLKRKIGDYATAASAVILTFAGGKVTSAAVTLSNVGDTALFADEAAKLLVGSSLDAATSAKARAGRRKDHIARIRQSRSGGVSHQGRRRDVRARGRPRQTTRRRLKETRMAKSHIQLKINNKPVEALVEPRTLLIHFLREGPDAHRSAYSAATPAIAAPARWISTASP